MFFFFIFWEFFKLEVSEQTRFLSLFTEIPFFFSSFLVQKRKSNLIEASIYWPIEAAPLLSNSCHQLSLTSPTFSYIIFKKKKSHQIPLDWKQVFFQVSSSWSYKEKWWLYSCILCTCVCLSLQSLHSYGWTPSPLSSFRLYRLQLFDGHFFFFFSPPTPVPLLSKQPDFCCVRSLWIFSLVCLRKHIQQWEDVTASRGKKNIECLKTEMLIILKKDGQWNHERKSNQLL